ncbi:MAG: N-acetyltransferase [Defluviicoccus sp.]|nr:N-acetyltransferase [Defluviicoccus sp.]MDG4610056.1 N-acetyltransferase [Defluviicoccus sp.]
MADQHQRDHGADGSTPPRAQSPAGAVSATIRPATLADIGVLAAIEAGAFRSDLLTVRALKHLIKRANAATLVHVASGGAISGYAVVLFHRQRPAARLYSIAVASGYCRLGYGAALLLAAEQAAADNGAKTMTLEVRTDSTAAQHLYATHGYSVCGKRQRYYADGTDAWKMRKQLLPRKHAAADVSEPKDAHVIKA